MRANDPRPPYLQVIEDMRDAIEMGRYQPGERLPSGRDLAKQYGVALMTMQKALNVLASEGLVALYQGRGAFVRTADGHTGTPVAADASTLAKQLDAVQADLRRLEGRIANLEQAVREQNTKPSGRRRSSA